MREHKVVVLGGMGSGKSTLVRSIAAGAVIDTDVANSDRIGADKASTTVALDYADIDLPNGERLRGASVKLLRWPDFRVLGHDHDGFRLCSLLLKRACTVDECAMLLELPAAAVRDFIHAAYLCGYAQLQSAPVAPMTAVRGSGPGTDNGLLARLWRHLRGSERNA